MAVDREFSNWEKTATVCHINYQMNRDPKRSREITILDFNPWSDDSDRQQSEKSDSVSWEEMGVMFKRLNNGR